MRSIKKEGIIKNVKQISSDLINLVSSGKMGTPNSYVTGSIVGNATVENINYQQRTAELVFNLKDAFRMGSATRIPKIDWAIINDNPTTSKKETILKNVYLNWTWREKVSF